jgi:hypothetical protein
MILIIVGGYCLWHYGMVGFGVALIVLGIVTG